MAFTNKKAMYNIVIICAALIGYLVTYSKPYSDFFLYVVVIGTAFTIPYFISSENKKMKYTFVTLAFLIGFFIVLITSLNM
ncbi:hypothetical protein P5663_14575 [Priestia flexa]|uniref:hypothetical protein n=1 Tax=Priestia flexa TaxID=86664 RepID=UPI000C2373BE|nr:hypothetical protein [Priestia flexa]MEC0668011.1 hypothetical protein [Priestia flexa]MED3823066.1 hypothetical protein [Priestia flexa]WEZ07272.1 hypothetical protein P5663_14575 [Priestia flexa]